jgi:hypothetical protein
MSYDKQNWQTGDVITANKLNHIEDGIANGGGGDVFVVHSVYDEQTDTTTLDKTWQEIHDATLSVIITDNPMMGKVYEYISSVGSMMGSYSVNSAFLSGDGVRTSIYACNSADGYPVLQSD